MLFPLAVGTGMLFSSYWSKLQLTGSVFHGVIMCKCRNPKLSYFFALYAVSFNAEYLEMFYIVQQSLVLWSMTWYIDTIKEVCYGYLKYKSLNNNLMYKNRSFTRVSHCIFNVYYVTDLLYVTGNSRFLRMDRNGPHYLTTKMITLSVSLG